MKLKTLLAVGLLAFSANALSAGVMKEMIQMKRLPSRRARSD